jgi:hypothetical protein
MYLYIGCFSSSMLVYSRYVDAHELALMNVVSHGGVSGKMLQIYLSVFSLFDSSACGSVDVGKIPFNR